MSQQKVVVILLLNVYLTSFVYAQYGSNFGNSNPGYGGTGTSVSSEDYGHKGQNPVRGPVESDGNSEPEPFNFAYQVKDAPTNTHFTHEANSDGKRVTGSYSVLLPDGRNQVVTYVADENGYNAKISYEGEAKPQPRQPGVQGGYLTAPGFPATAPKYPPPAYGSAPSPDSYPGSAYSAPVSGYSAPVSGYSAGSYGGSPPVPSYLVQVPTFKNGVQGSSRPKIGDFD
ncbi:pro-resilin-like [Metopolophium dirhodum]|uniref:pro-resilin-like n=1 Tax=Metopolophium dirhodum TaxID=44670 RepID=UPI0029901D15|nr:pro-resilin-like [Metopolophium dirhodum]